MTPPTDTQETNIVLPKLHRGQYAALRTPGRFKVLRCGRRWGKTVYAISLLATAAFRGQSVGYFTPEYKFMLETYYELEKILFPVIEQSSKVDGVIRLKTDGRIDFWTLNNPHAGRSRKYHGTFIDEAAFAGPDMIDIWQRAIMPTLLDYRGTAWVASTPNGADEDNFFYRICTDDSFGFTEFHAPTHNNPLMPKDELERLERESMPLVYRQEYLAEFVDWNGVSFFHLDNMLVDGKPVPWPSRTGQIYAIIDTAMKDGMDHDGTGVLYIARDRYLPPKLTVLDWSLDQIQGASLEEWLPLVFRRMNELAEICHAREGVMGAFIEDKGSGTVLLQQARKRGLKAFALPQALTALGKEARALSVSAYYHKGEMKISQYAFDKVSRFKGVQKNHFISQFCGFRMGDHDPKRADDLLDCGTCALAIGCGDGRGM